ncbi:Crp/Fnr family transcriptional regulator [Amycolatopsis cihanbeyliensis]|uniref:CRP-like cAMP-binding protein n=1 Tax=Amycolatopsis cihanbeyliensis TaxID=1128664 RepID=A0A542DF72_AMYCI|nr:Crp/Fnr family transcriptional regulator [Amycolatopsis cihanbeyliensis]TQJ01727.1 CRP-like cAMP-binding protein [Amycolatopsis cihanbeyliensis]
MALSKLPGAAMEQTMRLLGTGSAADLAIRQAAWVARCVGRGSDVPLAQEDLAALATGLHTRVYQRGSVLFRGGAAADGVWIVRQGRVELAVGSGRRRAVVHVLRPGDVDGDIAYLLDMPLPYTARGLDDCTMLFLGSADFEGLLARRPPIARRWLSSVAQRLAASQQRIIGLLGRSLTEQVARLLLDEAAADDTVPLPQRTLAAMLGVQRPSLNKILKEFERTGWIELRYANITILDPKGLAGAAG